MPKKILVIDDNLDMRAIMHLYLKTEGFTVVTAADGREGLYMASAERPDLIITDINMPDIDGIDLVKQLRAQAEFKDVPIIACTAYGIERRDETIRAGANLAIDKPIDLDSLIDDVNELLNQPKQK